MAFPVPHAIYALLIVLPPLTLLIAIPLILGWVKPNAWYGVRTRKTRSSPEIWYRANRTGGIYLVAATLIAVLLWALLLPVAMPQGVRALLNLVILGACELAASVAILTRVAKM